MLDQSMKQQLKTYLENLKTDIQLVLSLDESDTANQLASLANDIASLNDKVTVTTDNNAHDRKPIMQVVNPEKQTALSFAGLPMGHEFTSLVLALLHSGGHPLKLDRDTIDQIAALDQDLEIEIFISLSCQNCPDVVQAFNMMAAINPRIKPVMIDGASFQQEVTDREIMAVPTVMVNGEVFGQGRMTLNEILNKLDKGAAEKATQAISNEAVSYTHLTLPTKA